MTNLLVFKPQPGQVILRWDSGAIIHCPDCRANVFTKVGDNRYQCNGCHEIFVGVPANQTEEVKP